MQTYNFIESFQRGIRILLWALGMVGDWIINHPNRVLYVLIVICSFFARYFAIVILICLLAWSWFYGDTRAWRDY